MKLAGYENMTRNQMYDLARKIQIKYERLTEDGRKYFQLVGFGPIEVAKGIKELAKKARSEMVRLNAHGMAAKGTRLLREPEESTQGVKIIINCPTVAPQPGPGVPGRPGQGEREPVPGPVKPLQITK
jgi:hypothetical protein